MKKVICFLGALLFVMTGCATKSQSTETSKSSTTTSIEKVKLLQVRQRKKLRFSLLKSMAINIVTPSQQKVIRCRN